jgi:tight adherence protein B
VIANWVLLFAGLAVLLAAEAVYYLVMYSGERRRDELRRRLQAVATPGSSGASLLRERRIARSPALESLLAPLPAVQRLEQLLQQTDLGWTVASVLGAGCALGAGLSVLLVVVLRGSPALVLLAVPLGIAVPILLIVNARARRSQKLSTQLPDALDMMIRSLRAGHGIAAGFKLVATEMSEPVAVEFARCFEEQQVGVDFRDAVKNMTQRVPTNLDLKIFAVSVVIQHETGGNLIEILEKLSGTVRERFKFYGKLRALTVEAKASGVILGVLPFLCAFVVYLTRPSYLAPLVTDPLGRFFALGGLAMWLLGGLWMRKMAQVDY